MGRDLEIRLRLTVDKNNYLSVIEKYLKNEKTLDGYSQMVVDALKAFWYPLALHWQGAEREKVEIAILRANHLWQNQLLLMLEKTGVSRQILGCQHNYNSAFSIDNENNLVGSRDDQQESREQHSENNLAESRQIEREIEEEELTISDDNFVACYFDYCSQTEEDLKARRKEKENND